MEAASIDAGAQAMKALLLLNGGACIAILGFLASTRTAPFSQATARLTYAFVHSLVWFGGGAGLAVGASCLAYLCNSYYAGALLDEASAKGWSMGRLTNWMAVLFGLFSLVGFWGGLWKIYSVYF
jgi:hypothetical protein